MDGLGDVEKRTGESESMKNARMEVDAAKKAIIIVAKSSIPVARRRFRAVFFRRTNASGPPSTKEKPND